MKLCEYINNLFSLSLFDKAYVLIGTEVEVIPVPRDEMVDFSDLGDINFTFPVRERRSSPLPTNYPIENDLIRYYKKFADRIIRNHGVLPLELIVFIPDIPDESRNIFIRELIQAKELDEIKLFFR
jgi:hypothetical protein